MVELDIKVKTYKIFVVNDQVLDARMQQKNLKRQFLFLKNWPDVTSEVKSIRYRMKLYRSLS